MATVYNGFLEMSNLFDNFVVAGLSDENRTDLNNTQLFNHAEEILRVDSAELLDFTRYQLPLVSIDVIDLKAKETVPEGFQIIKQTPGGHNAAFNGSDSSELYLCYKRSSIGLPISTLGVHHKNIKSRLKEGATLIELTREGHRAALKFGLSSECYLVYTKSAETADIQELVVTDLVVIATDKGEACPPAFMMLEMVFSKNLFSSSKTGLRICYRKSLVKQHVIAYKPSILLNLPLSPYKALKDPAKQIKLDQVPEFCLPWGATIESWNVKQRAPHPTYSNFVLTTADSEQVFGAVLSFYEPFDLEKMTLDECYRLGCDPEILHARRISSNGNYDSLDTFTQEPKISLQLLKNLGPYFNSLVGERVVAVTKSICFLSKYSFSDTFESFLRALHKRCLTTDENMPIERLLAYFFYEIPLPSLKTPTISVKLFPRASDATLLLSSDHFSLANSKPLQISLEILGPELLIDVLLHLLMEQKLLITSILDQRLTPFCEAIISMLFPFRWTVCYVPFIHLGIVQIIQSPSPYLIGANSRFFDFFKLPSNADIAYLDVDTANFVPARLEDGTEISPKLLPKQAYKSLLKKLTDIKKAHSEASSKFKAELKLRSSSQIVNHDSAATNKLKEEHNLQCERYGKFIRAAILEFMVDVFGKYREYLSEVFHVNEDDYFRDAEFMKTVSSRETQKFYHIVFRTQMWASFIRSRCFPSSREMELQLFDQVARLKQEEESNPDAESGLFSQMSSFEGHYSASGHKISASDHADNRASPNYNYSQSHLDNLIVCNTFHSRHLKSDQIEKKEQHAPTEVTKLAPEIDWPLETSEEKVSKIWEPLCYHGRFPNKTLNLNLISEIRQAKCREEGYTLSYYQAQPTFERVSLLSRQFDHLDRFNLPDFPDQLTLNPDNPLHKYAAYLTRSQNEIDIGRHHGDYGKSKLDFGFVWAKHLTYNAYCLWFQLLPSYLASLPILAKCTVTHALVENYLEPANDGNSRLSSWLAHNLANDRSMLLANQARDILTQAVLMYSRMFAPAIYIPGDCVNLRILLILLLWYKPMQLDYECLVKLMTPHVNEESYPLANQFGQEMRRAVARYQSMFNDLASKNDASRAESAAVPQETSIEAEEKVETPTSQEGPGPVAASTPKKTIPGTNKKYSSDIHPSYLRPSESQDSIVKRAEEDSASMEDDRQSTSSKGTDLYGIAISSLKNLVKRTPINKQYVQSVVQKSVRSISNSTAQLLSSGTFFSNVDDGSSYQQNGTASQPQSRASSISSPEEPRNFFEAYRNRVWSSIGESLCVSDDCQALAGDPCCLSEGVFYSTVCQFSDAVRAHFLQMLRPYKKQQQPQQLKNSTSVESINARSRSPPKSSHHRRQNSSSKSPKARPKSFFSTGSRGFEELPPITGTKNHRRGLSMDQDSFPTSSQLNLADYTPSHIVVLMTNSTECPHCDHMIYDEEILAGWPNSDSEILTKCPHCSEALQPQLTVRLLAHFLGCGILGSPTPCQTTGPVNGIKPRFSNKGLVEIRVPFLSPLNLRSRLERLLENGQIWIPTAETLTKQCALVWNLVWWCYRIGLPTHLLQALPHWLIQRQTIQIEKVGHAKLFMDDPVYIQFTEENSVIPPLLMTERSLSESEIDSHLACFPARSLGIQFSQRVHQQLFTSPLPSTGDSGKAFDMDLKLAVNKYAERRRVQSYGGELPPQIKCTLEMALLQVMECYDTKNNVLGVLQVLRRFWSSVKTSKGTSITNDSNSKHSSDGLSSTGSNIVCEHEPPCMISAGLEHNFYREALFMHELFINKFVPKFEDRIDRKNQFIRYYLEALKHAKERGYPALEPPSSTAILCSQMLRGLKLIN